MRGPRELLFFHLVVLLHRINCYSNSCWAHRMFEISCHKVSSILSIHKLKFGHFFAKSSWSVLNDTVTERADIWGFGSTVGYHVTPHYQLLGSLHVLEIFKKSTVTPGGRYGRVERLMPARRTTWSAYISNLHVRLFF